MALGLVDRLGRSADVLAEGLAYARELVAASAPVRRTRDASEALADQAANRAALDAARADTAKKARGLFSPLKIVEAVEAALDKPFDEGLRFERELFLQCIDSPQRAGPDPRLLRRARSGQGARDEGRPAARDRVGAASSAAARWAPASRWPCSMPACR